MMMIFAYEHADNDMLAQLAVERNLLTGTYNDHG